MECYLEENKQIDDKMQSKLNCKNRKYKKRDGGGGKMLLLNKW